MDTFSGVLARSCFGRLICSLGVAGPLHSTFPVFDFQEQFVDSQLRCTSSKGCYTLVALRPFTSSIHPILATHAEQSQNHVLGFYFSSRCGVSSSKIASA